MQEWRFIEPGKEVAWLIWEESSIICLGNDSAQNLMNNVGYWIIKWDGWGKILKLNKSS